MRIFVLGTSNSVMTDGYIKALKNKHDVLNYSLGRVPCIYHIKVILEKRLQIEACDLLIIDHYINDVNRYMRIFGGGYFSYCEDLYVLLSSLNVSIVNVLFPILGMHSHINFIFYEKIIEINQRLKIEVIDLNDKYHKPEFFKDKLHLRNDLSFSFGVWLSNALDRLSLRKPEEGCLIKNPYFLLEALKLNDKYRNEIKSYQNSLININYLKLKKNIQIKLDSATFLIAIGYLKDAHDCDGLIVAGERIVLSRDGYLVELLDRELACSAWVTIEPLIANGSFYALGSREYVTGDFYGAKIVELIFRSEGSIRVNPAQREYLNLISNFPFET